jgi:hypothetical protein
MAFSITAVSAGSPKPAHHCGSGLVWVLTVETEPEAEGSFHLAASGGFGDVKSGPMEQALKDIPRDVKSKKVAAARIG